MDRPDAPWNGWLWMKMAAHTQKAIDSYANSPDQHEVSFAQGLAAGMDIYLTALKTDWRIKELEKELESKS